MALRNCPAMALIDFYQLAVLHKLSRGYGGVLSEISHPPPMPATKSPAFLSSSVRFDQTTLPEPKMPQHNHDATRSAPCSTPVSVGTSVLSKLRANTDQTAKPTTRYDCAKYEQYIVQYFERHRVFVDIEVFMKNVLHVPEDWEELWGGIIEEIKRSPAFTNALFKYIGLCETNGVREQLFYKPLADVANAILDFCKSSSSDGVKPRTPQRYLVNDPNTVLCGVINDLRPDLVAVHQDSLSHLNEDEKKDAQLHISNITWAQALQVLEVKPWDSALVDGACMPRLKANGESIDTSRGVFLKLTGSRERSAREPRPRLHAVTIPEEGGGGSPGHRSTRRRYRSLSARTRSASEAARGRIRRAEPEDGEGGSQVDSGGSATGKEAEEAADERDGAAEGRISSSRTISARTILHPRLPFSRDRRPGRPGPDPVLPRKPLRHPGVFCDQLLDK